MAVKGVGALDTTTQTLLAKQGEKVAQTIKDGGTQAIGKVKLSGIDDILKSTDVGKKPSKSDFDAAKKSVLGVSPVVPPVAQKTVANAPVEPKTVANAPVEPKKTTSPAVTDFANLGAKIGKKAETAFSSPLSRTEKADKPAATAPKGDKPQAAAPTQPPVKADKPAATAPKAEKPQVAQQPIKAEKQKVEQTPVKD